MSETSRSTGRSTGPHLHYSGPTPTTDAAQLSRMLFESRELISMLRDIVEIRSGKDDLWSRRVVTEIDEFRAERGWNPHGYGGEE